MNDLITALGLVLVVEGLLYGGVPGLVKRMAADVVNIPEHVLRVGGVVAIAIGVAIVWLARG